MCGSAMVPVPPRAAGHRLPCRRRSGEKTVVVTAEVDGHRPPQLRRNDYEWEATGVASAVISRVMAQGLKPLKVRYTPSENSQTATGSAASPDQADTSS